MASSRRKIKTLARLKVLRQLWGWEGKRVVFTNGVFDILHAGHVQMLEKSRSLGDVLIVALNSDASARRLGKGPGRPIVSLQGRAPVVAGLACVDAVVAFDQDTPADLVKTLRPDILVKGADYKKSEIAGARYAGKVVRVQLKKGFSSTAILRRARR